MKLLASRRFPGPAWAELGDVEYAEDGLASSPPRDDVDVLVVVGERVDDEVLDRFPRARLVANYGVGYDALDVGACARRGVAVTNTPGVLSAATADLTLALVLAVRRRLVEGDRLVREGRWGQGWSGGYLIGDEVTGLTLGIVGYGRIGREVRRRARGFDMRVLVASRSRVADDHVEQLELDELVAAADVVTLHVPLTDETRGLIGAPELASMRDGAALVNTARGAVVDEPALVRELVSGRLRAGLDVFAHEPEVPRELLSLPNVVLAPHVGSATRETREAMTRVLVDNVLAFAAGRAPPNRVA